MKIRTIAGILLFVIMQAAVSGQQSTEPERFSTGQTRAEQGKIRTLVEDAQADLNNVPGYLQSQLYSGAEVILLRAQGRLKQAQASLDAHPDMIQRTVNWMGFSPQSLRDQLTESYREVRNRFLEIEKESVALMRDFDRLNPESQLGYRTELIGYFESILNNIDDPALRAKFEAILERIRRAIQNNDLAALQRAFDEAFAFLREHKGEVRSLDLPSIPSLPANMANWGPFLDTLKERILGVRESHPDAYADLWSRYNLLVHAVGREDEEAARRLAQEIINKLSELGVSVPVTPPGTDPTGPGRGPTRPGDDRPQIPSQLDPSDVPGEGTQFVRFFNETRNRIAELNLQNQRRVADLLSQLRDAIRNRDWDRARRLQREIEDIFRSEGKTPPKPGDDDKKPSVRRENGKLIWTNPVTGEEMVFPADLTRPGIDTTYVGGQGARLVRESERFLEEVDGVFRPRQGEVRNWDFQIEEDQSRVDFVADGMKSTLVFRDAAGKTSYRVTGWSVVHTDSGREVASATSGRELAVTFREVGSYRVTVQGETDWDNPFRIEAILNISNIEF